MIRWVAHGARVVLGGLLIVTGALKLRAPATFATEIANYQILPGVAPYLAATLPMIEVVLGLALVIARGAWRRAAAAGALGLFVTFAVAVGAVYFRGINIDCGCFGAGGGPITGLTLLRNVGLIAAAAWLWGFEQRRWSSPPPRLGDGDHSTDTRPGPLR